jgi:hypothetical protein
MQRLPAILVVVVLAILLGATAAGGHGGARSVGVPGRLSIRLPEGWHVLHGWLSDVTDPAPRLAAASFPARLSRQTCACGFPHVLHFPRNGAFVFVWEYLRFSARTLASIPRRPARFLLTAAKPRRFTCTGPSEGFDFKEHGRYFQVEVYLGPAVGAATKTRLLAILDSLSARPLG